MVFKKIGKDFNKLGKDIKDGPKKFFDMVKREFERAGQKIKNAFVAIGNVIISAVLGAFKKVSDFFKDIIDKIVRFAKNAFKSVLNFLNMIRDFITSLVQQVIDFFEMVIFYINCTIKMIKNFWQCAIFYLGDILRYIFIHIPIIVFCHVLSTVTFGCLSRNECTKLIDTVEKYLKWPNDIQNKCYRCKNQKGDKFEWEKFTDAFKGKNFVKEAGFNFYFFTIVVLVFCAICKYIYDWYTDLPVIYNQPMNIPDLAASVTNAFSSMQSNEKTPFAHIDDNTTLYNQEVKASSAPPLPP